MLPVRRALVSVFDKTGLEDLGSGLAKLGVEIISTGGTARQLGEHGVPVTSVSEITGHPEILHGRVKSLHPRIFGGILADRRRPEHRGELDEHRIPPIDLVAVNLYPFEAAAAAPDATVDGAVEMIDIGGPSMVRAAAKNFANVAVMVDPSDYAVILAALENEGGLSEDLRRGLALKAFRHTRSYDAAIADWLANGRTRRSSDPPPPNADAAVRLVRGSSDPPPNADAAVRPVRGSSDPPPDADAAGRLVRGSSDPPPPSTDAAVRLVRGSSDPPPPGTDAAVRLVRGSSDPPPPGTDAAVRLVRGSSDPPPPKAASIRRPKADVASGTIHLELEQVLQPRYGENPHQAAAVYRQVGGDGVLGGFRQLQGKELSWNNLLDADAARKLSALLDGPDGRPAVVIVKHNNPCGVGRGDSLAEAYERALACDPVSAFGSIVAVNRPFDGALAEAMAKLFVEVVTAPAYEPAALERLGRKKNLRLLECPAFSPVAGQWELRAVDGGFLGQQLDATPEDPADWSCPTRAQPDAARLRALDFAWKVCRATKSNAIVVANEHQTVGIGAGQMSRVDSCRIALDKAQLDVAGTVAASDAFFPFRDGIDTLAEAGVAAIVQPGGSVRDDEVVAAADEHGIAMVLTGRRHFKH